MRNRLYHILLLSLLLLSACTADRKERSVKLQVLATTGMIGDAVRNVGGEHVDVTVLMGPGVDPHLYKASHGDVNRITSADIVLYNGLHLEGKMATLFEKAARTRRIIAVTKDIPRRELKSIDFENLHDPHVWFDVKLWKYVVATVSKVLQEADTINSSVYKANGERYIARLDSLDSAVRASIASIPERQRVLITAHDAFGYFGQAYGIEVRGLQGISTLSEFGLRDVTNLVQYITSRQIKAIFVETSVSTKSIDAVIEGCQERGWEVKIGGSLYSDAMGPADTAEGTYIGMIAANVEKIVKALK